jgi:hypothetical protein
LAAGHVIQSRGPRVGNPCSTCRRKIRHNPLTYAVVRNHCYNKNATMCSGCIADLHVTVGNIKTLSVEQNRFYHKFIVTGKNKTHVLKSTCGVFHIFVQSLKNFRVSVQIFIKNPPPPPHSLKFHENPSCGSRLVHICGHAYMMKLKPNTRIWANGPSKRL